MKYNWIVSTTVACVLIVLTPLSAATTTVGPFFYAGTSNYYMFVEALNISWHEARMDASRFELTDGGAGPAFVGYLTTVTSAGEASFLENNFPRNTSGEFEGYLGGSDEAVEGQWRWVTGPEAQIDGGQGLLFWDNGSTAEYHNWERPVEPSNDMRFTNTEVGVRDGEHYVQIYADSHLWNDLPNDINSSDNRDKPFGGERIKGYYLEFNTQGPLADPQVVDTSLAAYYPFNGNAMDESSNGNDGTVVGATLATDRFGDVNSAFRFDSTRGDRIEVNAIAGLTATQTRMLWIKPEYPGEIPDFTYVMDEGSGANFNNNWIELISNRVRAGTDGGHFGDTTRQVAADGWTHIAVTSVSGGDINIYINGVAENVGTAGTTVPSNIVIGGTDSFISGDKHFNGSIDEVRLYTRALSEQEILDLILPVPTTMVTNTNDSGVGSLRQAIVDVLPGGNIVFDANLSGQTITLTSGALQITEDVTINGLGADQLTVSGNGASRVFLVDDDDPSNQIAVMIDGLSITNAKGGFQGGAIRNLENLSVVNSNITNSSANGGGGGFFNSGNLRVENCTISGNSAVITGGGFDNTAGLLTVINSTISDNFGGDTGGGISNDRGVVTVASSTISGNSAEIRAGGIEVAGPTELRSSIVANNLLGGDCFVTSRGAITSLDHNLDSDGTCNLTRPNDLPNADPLLGPLTDNGGPTQTQALVLGSPAIDKGNNADCPETDQRGVLRPIDGDEDGTAVCDIGAYEFDPTALPDGTPPVCELQAVLRNPTRIRIGIEDLDSGVERIDVEVANNAFVEIPEGMGALYTAGESVSFDPPETTAFTVLGIKRDQTKSAQVQLRVTDAAGNFTVCDPVITLTQRGKGKPATEAITEVPAAERFVTVINGDPGLKNLTILVKGGKYKVTALRDNETAVVEIDSASMVAGNSNTFELTAYGKPGGSATVIIADAPWHAP